MPGGRGEGNESGIPDTGLTDPFATQNEKFRTEALALVESNTSLDAKSKRRQIKRVNARSQSRRVGGGKGGEERIVSNRGRQESFLKELTESDRDSRTGLGNTVADRTAAGGGVGAGAVGTFGRGVIGTNIIKKRRDA